MKKLLLISLLLLLPGCRHSANMSNPKVAFAVTLLDASNTTVTIADGLTAADHVLDSLRGSEPDYYNHVRPLLTKIAKANDVASQAIVDARNGGKADWKSALASVAGTVSRSDLTAFGFKNAKSQAIAEEGMAVLISGLTIAGQFGGLTK